MLQQMPRFVQRCFEFEFSRSSTQKVLPLKFEHFEKEIYEKNTDSILDYHFKLKNIGKLKDNN